MSLVTTQYTQRYVREFTSGLSDILRSTMEETAIPQIVTQTVNELLRFNDTRTRLLVS